jgi:hypothetical protein
MTRYIHHVTLSSGDVRRSPRDEVEDEAIASLHDFIATMIAGGCPAIPNFPAYTMTGAGEGKCLIATVWRDDAPIVTIGVAGRSTCGATLWRLMHDQISQMPVLATAGQPCPPEPWCAARLDIGTVILQRDRPQEWTATMGWLGNFERCLAWAWLSRTHD